MIGSRRFWLGLATGIVGYVVLLGVPQPRTGRKVHAQLYTPKPLTKRGRLAPGYSPGRSY